MHDFDDNCVGPHRVWLADEMTPGLAMSRSIGDAVAHSVGVTAVPEVSSDCTLLSVQLLNVQLLRLQRPT